MNISAPFIHRPIGTILLSIGLFLAGMVAYFDLPVASLPNTESPSIRVSASLPGADPETVAATVAAPLERRLGEIAGVNELTSTSQLGSVSIQVQFDLKRNVDDAARDVQAAINAAQADLPGNLARRPTLRKSNAASAPVMILAMTSALRRRTDVFDLADLIVSTRISQVRGVAEVTVAGSAQPSVRVTVDPGEVHRRNLSLEDIRTAITTANSLVPVGELQTEDRSSILITNSQIELPEDYANIVVKARDGTVVRLSDIARINRATSNRLSAGYYNKDPAVILIIQKTADANVVETVDQIKALLPELGKLLPPDVRINVLNDRTQTIRASIHDLELTVLASIALVMVVVFVFLRRAVPTIAAGLAVPLSLAGTVGLMWFSGYSINNMSLLALAISVGFVVDDAIVVIENTYRNMEDGISPMVAALEGARQIGFTIISISLSLIAAFIPLLFMGGTIGALLKEFSWTLTYAILISALISLTLTPMICGRFITSHPRPRETWIDRRIEPFLEALLGAYAKTLNFALRHRWLMLLVTLTALALTVQLYILLPKGLVPQGDTGLIQGYVRAAPEVSFEALDKLQKQTIDILIADPDVTGIGVSVGGNSGFGSSNQARFFMAVKPLSERDTPIQGIISRLRRKLDSVKGAEISMFPAQELQFGSRSSRSQYQITLWSPDLREVVTWLPRVLEAVRRVPGVSDVNSDREAGGPQAYLTIDRVKAAKFGVSVRDITNALNNAFSQRQISTIYGPRNQYKVVLEIDPSMQRSVEGISRLYVPGNGGQQVPLSEVTQLSMTGVPLAVNHQGQFPAVTISFNTREGVGLGDVLPEILNISRNLRLPEGLHLELAGETLALSQQQSNEPLLIVTAIVVVYLVLGILYEDLVHPLTILSTLPSAGFGALLTLHATGTGLSIVALIGIILLIGVVKKNGIMLVDFALDAERNRGLSAEAAIREACLERFRPILMTTLAAMLGGLPLLLASGPGSELRVPLGLTIIGGLAVSQLFTIYTTPVIYLFLDKLRWWQPRSASVPVSSETSTPNAQT